MTDRVTRDEVIAFRLGAHHLTDRLPAGAFAEASAPCGIQNSPPGSALLALHARVGEVTQEQVVEAVAEERSLLQTWCMRGAPFYLPVTDTTAFTTGVLPPTEASQRHFLLGAGPSLDRLGLTLRETTDLTRNEIRGVLSGRHLTINELGAEIAPRIAERLPRSQREIWQEEGPYAAGQPIGEGLVHFCLRILTLERIICFAPRTDDKAPFALVDEWLGRPLPDLAEGPDPTPEEARAELLRRYLRCYGPSTRGDFATWLGVRTGDTDPWWSPLEDELVQVEYAGGSWILAEDLGAVRSAAKPSGVRLLPPRDPYTQSRDRDAIVDRRSHREIWKSVGDPGTLLVNGEIAGTWRPRKKGRRLTLTVRTFRPLAPSDERSLHSEAQAIATLRGATSLDVRFEAY